MKMVKIVVQKESFAPGGVETMDLYVNPDMVAAVIQENPDWTAICIGRFTWFSKESPTEVLRQLGLEVG